MAPSPHAETRSNTGQARPGARKGTAPCPDLGPLLNSAPPLHPCSLATTAVSPAAHAPLPSPSLCPSLLSIYYYKVVRSAEEP